MLPGFHRRRLLLMTSLGLPSLPSTMTVGPDPDRKALLAR